MCTSVSRWAKFQSQQTNMNWHRPLSTLSQYVSDIRVTVDNNPSFVLGKIQISILMFVEDLVPIHENKPGNEFNSAAHQFVDVTDMYQYTNKVQHILFELAICYKNDTVLLLLLCYKLKSCLCMRFKFINLFSNFR